MAFKDGEKGSTALEIRTFGQFIVKRGNQLLNEDFVRSTKIWELFLFLLTHKNKNVSMDSIFDQLFREGEYQDPKSVLQNYVYRLRKLLFTEGYRGQATPIVFVNGCYRLELRETIQLDAEQFERLCFQAETTRLGDQQAALALYRQAIALYRGEYLSEYGLYEWIHPIRTYYKRLFCQCCLQLFDLLYQQQKYGEIVRDFEKIFVVEPYEERLSLYYMKALLAMQRPKEAYEHYEYITSIQYRTMGLVPTPEMRKMYKIINSMLFDDTGEAEEEAALSQELLEGKEAIYLEPDFFKALYHIERRRGERTGTFPLIGSVTFDWQGPKDKVQHKRRFMEETGKQMLCWLRKGDVLTSWSEERFLLMLTGLTETQGWQVLNRIGHSLKEISSPRGMMTQLSLQTQLPEWPQAAESVPLYGSGRRKKKR